MLFELFFFDNLLEIFIRPQVLSKVVSIYNMKSIVLSRDREEVMIFFSPRFFLFVFIYLLCLKAFSRP